MEAKIKFNVVYSYDVIIETAKEVQSKLTWQSNEQDKNLQLSSSWVRGMLDRASLRRQKITREDKAKHKCDKGYSKERTRHVPS